MSEVSFNEDTCCHPVLLKTINCRNNFKLLLRCSQVMLKYLSGVDLERTVTDLMYSVTVRSNWCLLKPGDTIIRQTPVEEMKATCTQQCLPASPIFKLLREARLDILILF